jgi:hypothetical protein
MRFQPGNSGGVKGKAGRKPRIDEEELGRLLSSCWKLKDRRAAIRCLARLANEGSLPAIQLLMAYAYGKPKERLEHSGQLEVGYIETWQDFKDQCQAIGVDPQVARQEAIRLIESSVEDADEDEEDS